MNRVDKLNRQYKKLRETYEELECMGPLEATVKSLQKDTEAVSETVLRVCSIVLVPCRKPRLVKPHNTPLPSLLFKRISRN